MATTWAFVIPWPIGIRGRYAGKPLPALSLNGSQRTPMAAAGTRGRFRSRSAAVAKLFRDNLRAPVAAERRRLEIMLIRGRYISPATGRAVAQQMLDKDGLYVALKPFVDGLVDAGWLVDDRRTWCDYDADQERGDVAEVRVTVTVL